LNTEPLPGSLVTVTSPPIMRASLREIARPSRPAVAACGQGGYHLLVGDSRSSRTSDESVCCLNLFTVDFKKGADKKVGRRFFDRKANGVSSARESPVPK
jgi:hypothetical protein